MKSKLLFFDLAICSVWLLSMFGGRGCWAYTALPFIVLEGESDRFPNGRRRSEKMIKKCLHVYFCCSQSSYMKEKIVLLCGDRKSRIKQMRINIIRSLRLCTTENLHRRE